MKFPLALLKIQFCYIKLQLFTFTILLDNQKLLKCGARFKNIEFQDIRLHKCRGMYIYIFY